MEILPENAAEAKPENAGTILLIASTENPVRRGMDTEILLHNPENVRLNRLRTFGTALINHDIEQRVASIISAEVVNRKLQVRIKFGRTQKSQDAKLETEDGILKGISIGYRIYGINVDESTRTYTATDWEPFEVTLTPIPADDTVMIARSLDAWNHLTKSTQNCSGNKKERTMADAMNKEEVKPVTSPSVSDESVRAAIMQETREISTLARSVGLEPDGFIGLKIDEAKNAILRSLAEKNKTPEPKAPAISLTVDQTDKARDAFACALAAQAGVRSAEFDAGKQGNPLVGKGINHAIRSYAKLCGINSSEWSRKDAAFFALGRTELMEGSAQRSVNITTGSFPNFVMLNAITKIVARGFEQGSAGARYRNLVEQQMVPDFKQFSIGALGTGVLQKTAEGLAFPELDKSEGVYNSTAKMWGGTLSLSLQALINDDTASFDRSLRSAGAIADKTIDRRVFQKLLMGTSSSESTSTWTSNTTSGGSLVYTTADLASAARGRLALVRAALINKVGLDGNPLGTIPRFLICGPTREVEALGIVGGAGPILSAGPSNAPSLEVVATPWLEASALTGSSTTSYYLLADPLETTGLVLSKINGFENIQVQPYDSGAVAAANWKLWLPFEADLVYVSVNGTNTVAAAQQGTT